MIILSLRGAEPEHKKRLINWTGEQNLACGMPRITLFFYDIVTNIKDNRDGKEILPLIFQELPITNQGWDVVPSSLEFIG